MIILSYFNTYSITPALYNYCEGYLHARRPARCGAIIVSTADLLVKIRLASDRNNN
jgi:hypothetical protein